MYAENFFQRIPLSSEEQNKKLRPPAGHNPAIYLLAGIEDWNAVDRPVRSSFIPELYLSVGKFKLSIPLAISKKLPAFAIKGRLWKLKATMLLKPSRVLNIMHQHKTKTGL